MKTFVVAVVLCLAGSSFSARLPLVATPIQNGGLYKIESQADGAYLVAGDDGVAKGGEYTGRQSQKWIFTEVGPDTYTLKSLENENNNIAGVQYLTIKVSHGKRLFQNTATGLCITNGGRGRPVTEKECGRDTPSQRWNVQEASTY